MSKKTTLLTVVVAAVLLLAVVAIAMNAPNRQTPEETTNDTETTQPSSISEETDTNTDEAQVAATITYTDDGFEPANITVKSGDVIRVENKSSMPLSFNSDDHPAHTEQNDLNVNDVPRGGSRTFTVNERGTWGFHNHDNAIHTGKIIVE